MEKATKNIEELLAQIMKNAEGLPYDTTPNGEKRNTDAGKTDGEWKRRLEDAGIYERFRGCTFADMEKWFMPKDIREGFERVRNYAEHFDEYRKKGIGLILSGPVGVMKTSMAAALVQEALRNGRSALFVPMAELFDRLITMNKGLDNAEFMRFEGQLKDSRLLVLDDLGTEYPNDWIRNKVDAIISYRYNRMYPICITTNLNKDEILGRYQERVYDRLKSTSIAIGFTSTSQRTVPEEFKSDVSKEGT